MAWLPIYSVYGRRLNATQGDGDTRRFCFDFSRQRWRGSGTIRSISVHGSKKQRVRGVIIAVRICNEHGWRVESHIYPNCNIDAKWTDILERVKASFTERVRVHVRIDFLVNAGERTGNNAPIFGISLA